MKRFTRTDLACEREDGSKRKEYELHGYRVCEVEQIRRNERILYTAVHTGLLMQLDNAKRDRAAEAVATQLAHVSESLVGRPSCVLVACLGNPRITPDSLGPCVAKSLEVTRHVQLMDRAAFARFGKGSLCLVAPGVLGDTGVESAELVRGAVRELGTELVVAVDALAASSLSNLGSVVQICDHGLQPGSGTGSRRPAIDREEVGCPVISLGIPTVTDSASMICDALSMAGICGVGESLSKHLAHSKRYLVAPGNVDELVQVGAQLLASAIGRCFGIF